MQLSGGSDEGSKEQEEHAPVFPVQHLDPLCCQDGAACQPSLSGPTGFGESGAVIGRFGGEGGWGTNRRAQDSVADTRTRRSGSVRQFLVHLPRIGASPTKVQNYLRLKMPTLFTTLEAHFQFKPTQEKLWPRLLIFIGFHNFMFTTCSATVSQWLIKQSLSCSFFNEDIWILAI